MKNKVFLGSLFLIFVLFLTSCGVVSIGNNEGQLTFTLGDDVAALIASRQASDGGDYKIAFTLSGDYSATLEKTATLSTLATTPFEFKGIPMGATVRASCIVSTSSGVQLWSGSSNSIKIAGATNRASITLGVHSGIVVWDGSTDAEGTTVLNLSIASSPASVGSATELETMYDLPVFTFGNNVELYYLNENQDNVMVSRRDVRGVYPKGETGGYEEAHMMFLSYDRGTGKLYGSPDDGMVTRLEDGATYESSSDAGGMDSPAGFVVENDVFYLYSEVSGGGETTSSNSYQITVGKYTIDFDSLNEDGYAIASELAKKTITLPIDGLFPDSYENISDAIIQDGALYLLLRDVDIPQTLEQNSKEDNLYSRGGLIKINLSTMELDTSFGDGGILGWTESSARIEGGNNFSVNYYGGNADGSKFIGPTKFVGIMPKKLIIADVGAFAEFHTDGLKGSTKSRLVEVDLEKASASVKWTSEDNSSYYYCNEMSFSGSGWVSN